MVRTELAALPPGVMEAGANEQLRVLGNPAQVNSIAALKAPDCGTAETVIVPDWPDTTVSSAGDAAKATVGVPPDPPVAEA